MRSTISTGGGWMTRPKLSSFRAHPSTVLRPDLLLGRGWSSMPRLTCYYPASHILARISVCQEIRHVGRAVSAAADAKDGPRVSGLPARPLAKGRAHPDADRRVCHLSGREPAVVAERGRRGLPRAADHPVPKTALAARKELLAAHRTRNQFEEGREGSSTLRRGEDESSARRGGRPAD